MLSATIELLYERGYSGTPTEVVAERAKVSRGALRHHFPTRADLMAEVIAAVYEGEQRAYEELTLGSKRGSRFGDWPELLWEVLSRPSGVAVLEILQASRSDAELAARVAPLESRLERLSLLVARSRFPAVNETDLLNALRLFVWAARGLSIARVLVDNDLDVSASITLLGRLIDAGVTTGLLTEGGISNPEG